MRVLRGLGIATVAVLALVGAVALAGVGAVLLNPALLATPTPLPTPVPTPLPSPTPARLIDGLSPEAWSCALQLSGSNSRLRERSLRELAAACEGLFLTRTPTPTRR